MRRALFAILFCASCDQPAPPGGPTLDSFLPPLPSTGGPRVAFAGKLTEDNFATERVTGPASQGLPGDYFMRNDKIRVIVQAPNRAIGPCPFGGTILDADRIDEPAGDQLGEIAPFLQLGRTVDFQMGQVLLDGSQGGPAVLRFRGRDVVDDYINVTGVGGFAGAIESDFRADVDLGLDVAVTYLLAPGATHVEAIYTFFNGGANDRATSFGTITDTGAQIEMFHPHVGYGEFSLNDLLTPNKVPLVEYSALQAQGITYGVVPILDDPKALGAPFPLSGVDVEMYQLPSPFSVFGASGQNLVVPSLRGVDRTVDVMIASDVADVERQVRARKGQVVGEVEGVVRTMSGAPSVGARVLIEDPALDPSQTTVTTCTTDENGAFHASLPVGAYRATAEATGFFRGAPVTVDVTTLGTSAPMLKVPDPAPLDYKVHDEQGAPIPSKITVVGAIAATPDRRFRDCLRDPFPVGIAGWIASRDGDSSKNVLYDHPLKLAPGHYRVVVGRGPEWSRFEQVIDLPPTGMAIDATLTRVLDTSGYVACDFHQHTNVSPDSPVPPLDRVVTYLAEGIEVVSTSEHDVHLDYAPLIAQLNAQGLLDSMVGVEVTPFDYGHFIGFPMPIDPLSPNGGALDWGDSPTSGLDRAPGEIFDGLRGLGAQVVQVNHPRGGPGSLVSDDFQKNFDRAALTFDFAGHSFGGASQLYPVKATELGLPDGASLFSPNFDSLEVYNGVGYRLIPDGDSRLDPLTDEILRDWMNFLSFGFTPTAVGDSDSHEWVAAPPGLPRTMVRVPDDSGSALLTGISDEVVKTVSGKSPRDAIVTNTPMIALSVDGASIGNVAMHKSGPMAITIRVQTPTWAPVDTVEIFANATFDVPYPKGTTPLPPPPIVCFTNRSLPTARCSAAVGGAQPLAFAEVMVTPSASRHEVNLSTTLDPADVLARQRPGGSGKDLWIVARATGDVGLFPTVPQGIDPADVAALVDGGSLSGRGVGALAFTNPVFVDVDGNGWKAPFAP
jgi:hypothetical protein